MARKSTTQEITSEKTLTTERQIPDKYNSLIIAVDDGNGSPVPEAEIEVCIKSEGGDWIPIRKQLVRDMQDGELGVTLHTVPERVHVEVTNTGTTTQTLRVTTLPIK